jgi:hypothetical protein
MMPLSLRSTSAALLVFASLASADGPSLAPLRFQATWEAGQVEQGFYYGQSKNVDKELINHATVWTLQEARLGEHAKAFMGVGGGYFFVFPRNLGSNPYSMSKRSAFALSDAHGEFGFLPGNEGEYGLLLKAGIFPFKYNPDAKDLGEYMYRTWTYPTIITTGGLNLVGSAGAQLSGLSIGTRRGGFSNDLLLTVQTDRPPVLGLSLADIASYKIGILEFGAGFMLDNFYNPDPLQATPESPVNSWYTLSDGSKMSAREYADLSSQSLLPAGVTVADTGYYTMIGQKAMLRAAVDLGKAIGIDALGPQDLRLYGEAIVMGLKEYPTYYEKIGDRVAWMAGLNLPAFRLLDLLSIEVEHCANPFANSARGPLGEGMAAPHVEMPPSGFPNPKAIDGDDWKWALYARKDVMPGFAVHFQAANDHMKMLDVYSTPDFYDFLVRPSHWYWVVNLSFSL